MAEEQKIILFHQKENCCSCAACMNVCPQKAISMKEDVDGYLYPEIDCSKCVGCGLCKRVCTYQNGIEKIAPIEVKAASAKSSCQLLQSSSGGIFSSLALAILQEEGVVYGAGYQREGNQLNVLHIRVTSVKELHLLQGSKYAQSMIGVTYTQAKADLLAGKRVLFSGTPCQIAGLKGYLRKNYENLYTIDIVCHGVPNLKQFNNFIQYLERKYNGTIEKFSFRDKEHGWSDYFVRADVRKNNENTLIVKNTYCKNLAYYEMFLSSDIHRCNCYSCPYACKERIGDITLGDYWGFENVHPELCTDIEWRNRLLKGISCVLLNTNKGRQLYKQLSGTVLSADSAFEKAAKENGQLQHPSPKSKNREELLQKWNTIGYDGIQKEFKKNMGIRYYYIYARKTVASYIKKWLWHFKETNRRYK